MFYILGLKAFPENSKNIYACVVMVNAISVCYIKHNSRWTNTVDTGILLFWMYIIWQRVKGQFCFCIHVYGDQGRDNVNDLFQFRNEDNNYTAIFILFIQQLWSLQLRKHNSVLLELHIYDYLPLLHFKIYVCWNMYLNVVFNQSCTV